MQQIERSNSETVVGTIPEIGMWAQPPAEGESLAELAHEARNMVTALAIYCDLLEEPGVLDAVHKHFARELRMVTGACRQIVEKLGRLDGYEISSKALPLASEAREFRSGVSGERRLAGEVIDGERQINNLQKELLSSCNVLDAMAGSGIRVELRTEGGARPVALTSEEMTRVLVNLVKNAAEAIGGTGAIRISLREKSPERLSLVVEDNGPGFSPEVLQNLFQPGFSTRGTAAEGTAPRTAAQRGLGLSITRNMIEAAGGSIRASNGPRGGARFEIDLPIRSR